jgi:hypothetical protein
VEGGGVCGSGVCLNIANDPPVPVHYTVARPKRKENKQTIRSMNRFQSRCVMFCVCVTAQSAVPTAGLFLQPGTGLFLTTREFRREFVVAQLLSTAKSRDSRGKTMHSQIKKETLNIIDLVFSLSIRPYSCRSPVQGVVVRSLFDCPLIHQRVGEGLLCYSCPLVKLVCLFSRTRHDDEPHEPD